MRDELVNCWILAKDLEALAKDERQPPALRAFAAAAHGRYQYPVDSQLYAPDGRFLAQLAANDLFHPYADPNQAYAAFLGKARSSQGK
jgi:hypothetical protein